MTRAADLCEKVRVMLSEEALLRVAFHEVERIVHKNIDVNALVFDEEDDYVVPVDEDELDDDEFETKIYRVYITNFY